MSTTIGNAKDLDTSRNEALQGLLSSLGHAKDNTSSGGRLPARQVRKLSEKIDEILGDGAMQGDQSGQLLNEEGLPILDISELVNENSQTGTLPSFIPEPEFIPLSLLPPDEKERRQRERDRILDLLEEEERLQQLQEERDAKEERKEAIKKRKESAKAELQQLKAAQELQKKMGHALVRQAKGTEEQRWEEDACLKPQVTSPVAKKRVTFAAAPAVEDDKRDQQTSIRQLDWGDVTLGRLRAQDRIPLVSATEAQKYPMKVHVVERHPTATPTSPIQNGADSDDESPSAGDLSPHTENGSSDEDKSSLNDGDLLDDELLEEGFDYDAAEHHREIALEYHKKRHTVSAETAKALAVHAFDEDDQHETPQSHGQSPLSRFRADRMAAAYDESHGPISTSIGQTVIPASRLKSLQNSVRLGKLEHGWLVGGESGESGSEGENVREVLQMLQAENIQNAGPDFEPSSMSSIVLHRNSDAVESTAAHGVEPSKFKLAHEGRVRDGITVQDNNNRDNTQSRPTISSVVERKTPRSTSTSQRFLINKPSPRSSAKAHELGSSMIIDSPSFPVPASASTIVPSSSSSQMSPRAALSVERPISRFMAKRAR